MATTLTEFLRLPKSQSNKMNKEQILDLIEKTDNTGNKLHLVASFTTLTNEISQLRQEITEGKKEKEMSELHQQYSKQSETIIKQQLYLE